ncbi:hypothetical protein ACFFUB_07940 [Algimonas porphyrae]|uniref:5-carboxymethyl-2-hydroxymuconate isomerase n=1 Tax=Algimonas porphyrae TaxID=1128113 RepID=A0ABQ5V0E2_9PROT|nr:hypothetical protein [Algimonas porphyrae]GLQ20893.1 hypothetical protein GCM10007854_18480 [Algimonas porphyrae]
MPHIILTHTSDLTALAEGLLSDLCDMAETQGFDRPLIKAYTLPIGSSVMAGVPDAPMLRLTLRILSKAERTPDMIAGWLDDLLDRAGRDLPGGCILTGEAVALPEHYVSRTIPG